MTTTSNFFTWLTCVALSGCLDARYGRHRDHEEDDALEQSAVSDRAYYVRADGDDARSGLTPADSWRSLARVNRQVFEPGEALYFQAGDTFEGTLTLQIANGGSARAPVRVSAFGRGRATIAAGAADGVVLEDLSGVQLERLTIRGDWSAEAQSGNDGEGVSAIGTQQGVRHRFLRLRELEVSGFKAAGIGLHARPEDEASKNGGFEDVEISDCVVHDNGDFGVLSDGPYLYDGPGYSHFDVRVRRVNVHHTLGLSEKGSHTGSGIVLSDVDGGLVERSVAHDNGARNDAEGGGYGIWAWDSHRVTIQYNESYANRTMTADGGGFDLDGGVTASVLRFNYSHDNQGAGYGAFQFEWARPYSGNRIYGNISQNDGFGFLVWDGNGDMGSLDVLQNTSYGQTPAVKTYSAFQDVTFINNIFYGVGPVLGEISAAAGLTLQGNVYFTGEQAFVWQWEGQTYGDLKAFQDATGQEVFEGRETGSERDPQLVAAGTGPTLDDAGELGTLGMYRLRVGSGVIDRGVEPGVFGVEQVGEDFFGGERVVGGGVDPGVDEVGG